jgi:tetratricopeptide (TPR) repeat protein
MLKFASQNETIFELEHFLDELQTAEICHDFDRSILLFSNLNWNYQDDCDFSHYDIATQAKLLRSAGYFLAHFGRAKKIVNYQERSKNALTRAIEIFESLQQKDLSIECHIQLSAAYWFESGLDEADIIQKISEEELGENKDWLYLLLQINSLAVLGKKNNGDHTVALHKVCEIETLVESCDDFKLKTQFYNEAGIVYRKNNNPQKAEECLRLAVQFARILKAPIREGLALNSLAMLKIEEKEYEIALTRANDSLKIFQTIGHIGWIPHILDTIAQIHFAQHDFDSAYQFIRESVMKFRNSDDYLGLCDALSLQVKICFKLGMRSWAIDSIAECVTIATNKISQEKAQFYKDEFSDLFYVNNGSGLDEMTEHYIRYQLEAAFNKTKSVSEAARLLKVSPSRLSSMRKNYRDTFDAFEVNTKNLKQISSVVLTDVFFDFQTQFTQFDFYELPKLFKLGQFIAVVKSTDIEPNALILYQQTQIQIGKLVKHQGKWAISDYLTNHLFLTNEVKFLGEIIAVSHQKNHFVRL